MSRIVLQGRPELRRRNQNVFERIRHHPYHGIAGVVERDLAPDHRGIAAKATPPQCIAEDHHVWPVESIVGGLKVSSQKRRHT